MWLAAGVVYYQLLRFPRVIVAIVLWARRPYAPEFVGELSTEERSTSET
jgi:hypothetical protein